MAACDEPCGEHADCAATDLGGVCECVPGYEGDPCVWTGAILDSEFTDPRIWSDTTNGATIIPLAQGESGMGIASFASSVVCNAGAVSQVVTMPDYEDAEPFVAQVTFREQSVEGVVVGYNRAFRELPSSELYPAWTTTRLCLGEAAYGGDVKFQVAASERTPDCFNAPAGLIEVDRFSIEVAEPGECPAPGSAANGTADVDGGGWRFIVGTVGEGFPEIALTPGIGQDGTDGVRFAQAEGTTRAGFASTQVSVPLSSETTPPPALRFWYDARGEGSFEVGLGTTPSGRVVRHPLDTLVGTGVAETATYCLPPYTHGNVLDLFFGSAGALESELFIDEVEVVPDSRCGTSTNLLDPDFDSAPNRWPGVTTSSGTKVAVIDDAARALPPGSGVLEVRYTNNMARANVDHWVWVPPPDEGGNPVLVFHADAPGEPGVGLFWSLTGTLPVGVDCVGEICPPTRLSQTLTAGGGWLVYDDVCLPPEWAERWFRFRVAVRPEEGPLEVFDSPRSLYIDDFEVTTSPICP